MADRVVVFLFHIIEFEDFSLSGCEPSEEVVYETVVLMFCLGFYDLCFSIVPVIDVHGIVQGGVVVAVGAPKLINDAVVEGGEKKEGTDAMGMTLHRCRNFRKTSCRQSFTSSVSDVKVRPYAINRC